MLGRAALLAGLIPFRVGPEVYGLVWPDNEKLRSGDPVLAPLLSDFDTAHRSRAALGLHTLHLMQDEEEAAARTAQQVVAIDHPDFVGAAWLGLAEVLVSAGAKAAAAEACERSAATAPGGRPVSAILGVEDDSTADVPTRAKTLLGILQREAGDDDLAVRTLTDAARGDDPEAVFALAQTHPLVGVHLGQHRSARTRRGGRAAYRRANWLSADTAERLHGVAFDLGDVVEGGAGFHEVLRVF
ncbi:hypothetical protein AB0L64_31300 [Kribbella sp. NPDC051936]|uniref:hypothetical protein n=1 Tax=Kribbella sp. NPDC051936 TaxID=3154946 RepID=UPI003430398B